MHHSHSTPAGVDGGGARTPPTTPRKGGKMLAVRVHMLDDTLTIFQLQAKALGRVLFEQVCKQLHLLEADYFGLEYQDLAGTRYWLDLQKPVSRQLGLSLVDPLLHFCVKFYTPDPAQLEEEFTRYLFCLQVKRDLAQGFLQCNDNTAALMASYIVQAECGDYVVEDYPDHTYLSSYKFVPHQDQELERRIMENHKKHAGQSPAEADLNLLETARRCELYGMKMHPAKDHDSVLLNLAVAHMGIVVFQNYTKINTFSWAKIRKISFKRKRFLIKLHPEGYGYYKDTVEFFFEGRNECKNFWKKCVENHGFFRCSSVKHIPRQKTRVLSRGSSFRYSGRTQKQIVEFVRDNYVKRQTFQRSASFRHSSAHSSAANVHSSLVGNSISAHPLLPLADNSLVNAGPAGSNLSTSLGSMGPGRVPVSPTMKAAYHLRDTATSWSTGQPPATSITSMQDCRTMSSPSPPLTTQSASPATSAATSPQRTDTSRRPDYSTTCTISQQQASSQPPPQHQGTTGAGRPRQAGSPVSVHAAVHRADTGQTTSTSTTCTTCTTPPHTHSHRHNTTRYHTHTNNTTTRTTCNHQHVYQQHQHLKQKSEGSLDRVRERSPPPRQAQSQIELGSKPSAAAADQDGDGAASSPEYHMPYAGPQYHSEMALPKRQLWQRSASCRDLYDFSFEDSGQAKRHAQPLARAHADRTYISMEERKLESPITRYDDVNRALYDTSSARNVNLDIHQDIIAPGQKVYSSSYPGTTSLSQESMEDPGNYELAESQDDLSHDSYELLERSDDEGSTSGEYRHRKTRSMNTRSCSLDSGNYLPTDTDSDSEKHHKYKSSSDVHQDIFLLEDPRDFPREKIPRNSDGSFYKNYKVGSRTPSLESKTDYYENKQIKSSRESLKKGWERGLSSRTSSQESKSDYENKKPQSRKNKSFESIGAKPEFIDSRTSSLDSKSDYFDANSKIIDEPKYHSYRHEYDRKIQFERNYGTQKTAKATELNYDTFPSFKETSHVHSISLQNVETEQNIRANRMLADLEQNTVPRTHKASHVRPQKSFENDQKRMQTTHIWPENIAGVPTELQDWTSKPRQQRSTESESNIFSFDEEKIQSLQESDLELGMCAQHSTYSIVSAMNQTNADDFKSKPPRNAYRDVFMEIDPKRLEMSRADGQLPMHQPIERTKSDPNSIANRQRLSSNSRRHTLMHQKSIDLTPAESSDEDYIFKQIPSAPPLTKHRGTHFEMPAAEFGHFDILKREIEGQRTKFEVPKSQFEVLGAKTQSDLTNLPPKNDFDIPYVLHKRHMMNGTASKVDDAKFKEVEAEASSPKWKNLPEPIVTDSSDECRPNVKIPSEPETSSFLFTQNIDLSKIDPVTLEVDKSEAPIQHTASPKRDITKIDPVMLEALSSKLSQIESDSPTSSKTESLKPELKAKLAKVTETEVVKEEPRLDTKPPKQVIIADPKQTKIVKDKIKTELKPKRVIKPRMQPNKKGGKNKTKVRITSFSSDDESLDSDDVFGSAEATPTKLEFSPPQTRKEMESILKYESERQTHLQYTMSSTEIEGSPPQARKTEYLPYDRSLDPNYQSEQLRRISERSISIPSSEEDVNLQTVDLTRPVFGDPSEAGDGVSIATETLTEKTFNEPTIIEHITEIERDEEPPKDLGKDKPVIVVSKESPAATRKKGQTPLLFAHARLNLSEGSAFAVIQRQAATTSPTAGRRAKSLDAPIISVNKLPPLNSFSSKDDTVEETETAEAIDKIEEEIIAEKLKVDETVESQEKVDDQPETIKDDVESVVEMKENEKELIKVKKEKKKPEEKDQIVPDVMTRTKRKTVQKLPSQKSVPEISTSKEKIKMQRSLPSKEKPVEKLPRTTAPKSIPPKPSPRTTSLQKSKDRLPTQRSLPVKTEREKPTLLLQKSLPAQQTLQLPEVKKAKGQELESKKSKSLEKLEFKRAASKERAKSQEDSDSDIAKRIEKQQMLYETAIKQTKTLKSPVKDALPVFPTVEETVRVNDGKLEISIDTIENTNIPLEEAIIITKSPKKLDKKFTTKSLELNLTEDSENNEQDKGMQRLGKSLDLEQYVSDENEKLEFDFKPEKIKSMADDAETKDSQITPTSPESDGHVVEQVIEAEVHKEPALKENVVLEGTSLDIWLSVEDPAKKLDKITVIQKGTDSFFEDAPAAKAPDICETAKLVKSSSESHSSDKQSLGNSLDIKYIDDSGDSSHKSEKDSKLIADLRKAKTAKAVKKVVGKKDENSEDKTLVRITSEDESLTEVSELKFEAADSHLLGFADHPAKESLLKLSIERSRSENTDSWITVECDEYLGVDSFDVEEAPLESPEKVTSGEIEIVETKPSEIQEPKTSLLTTEPKSKSFLLKHSSDHSRSSDTTGSWTSGEKDLSPGNLRETGDESSVSCSIAKTIGISQVEQFDSREQLDAEARKMHTLERHSPIDEESSSASNGFPKNKSRDNSKSDDLSGKRNKYPFEQKWASDSELSQRIHQKISKKLSSADKNSLSSLDDSISDKRWNGKGSMEKPTLQSVDKLSLESRNSLDTESSSGSLGVQARLQKTGEIPVKEASSTWRPFLVESSGSSSLEEGFLPPDQEGHEYYFNRQGSGEYSSHYDLTSKSESETQREEEQYDFQDELAEFPTGFGYPCLSAAIGIGATDMLAGYGTGFLARTLSRISERSTNSENTSLEEDSTKASTQSDSVNDESLMSSDHQASLSSDPPSNEKKGSGSSGGCKPEKEPNGKQSVKHVNNLLLHRQVSDDRRTSAEMADLSIDDIEIITSERGLKLKRQDSDDTIIDEEQTEEHYLKASSSQESEDWPLPDIPTQIERHPYLEAVPSVDKEEQFARLRAITPTNIPKTFGQRASLKSQDSEQWPSPPSSLLETPVVGNVEASYYMQPEEACKVTVDPTYENDSSEENKTLENDYAEVDDDNEDRIEEKSTSNSDSTSGIKSGIKIILQTKSGSSNSNSEEDYNATLNDDVFTDVLVDASNELRPPTVLRRSTTSDDSSHSAAKGELRPPSQRASHSSYSEEECTSSVGTNFEEGTVRFALRPAKCTHSSHSEDTSVALSLSEWSSSTNTVKFQNISNSNNSGTNKSSTNTSGGLKSDDNSLTDIAHSISDWSSSNSNTLVAHQFQKLSTNSSTGDSTLTEMVPTISEWSSSDTTQTMVPQNVNTIDIEGCLEQLLEEEESLSRSLEHIPSEDLAIKEPRHFTKSTERPVTIPVRQLIEAEHTKSTERPVKVPLKLSKCSPYYSSSLSSESTSVSKPMPIAKTSSVPLSRAHRKTLSKSLLMSKSPPSENDSTSSVESPVGTPEGRARAHRRRRQAVAKRHKLDRERSVADFDDDIAEEIPPERFMCGKDFSDLPSDYEYKSDIIRRIYSENVEEGYFPDGDSQSGSDIFRTENEPDDDGAAPFDVSLIPPPLLEDDMDDGPSDV